MTMGRTRSLLATIAAAAVFGYGLAGHGMPLMGHDGMAGAVAGFCLLLATALQFVVARRPQVLSFSRAPAVRATPVGQPRPAPLDGRAPASPTVLQRFLT